MGGGVVGVGERTPPFDPAPGQTLTAIPVNASSRRSWGSDASLVSDTDLFPFTVELRKDLGPGVRSPFYLLGNIPQA